jgi:lipoyl(octanoyl) transferase
MNMVQTSELNGPSQLDEVAQGLVKHMLTRLKAEHVEHKEGFENE